MGAERLVFGVVEAERIAVGKDEAPFGQHEVEGVGQQAGAGCAGKALAEQEVAVAVHEADVQAGIGRGAQGSDDARVVRVVDIVVADPGLEEVAEDVQAFGLPGAAGKKAEEQSSRPG
jgi:hypothetical protein